MTTIKLRNGTAAQWVTANPVLANGEPGFESDTGKHKIGNGSSVWTALGYFIPESQVTTLVNAAKARATHTGTQTLSTISDFDAEIRKTDADCFAVTGVYPLRNTVTADSARRVRWVGPTAPTIGSGYAIDNFDVWEQTA